jgi:predicted secreted protein
MKNKPLFFAILYSLLYITVTLFLYFTERYAVFNMVYLLAMGLIIPMVVLTIKVQRDGQYGGYISGKNAAKEGMKFVMYSVMILMVFQAFFYYTGWREFKADSLPHYVRSKALELDKLGKRKFNEEQLQVAIKEELKNITLFKELTFVFFRTVFIGLFSSLTAGFIMKKAKPSFSNGILRR